MEHVKQVDLFFHGNLRVSEILQAPYTYFGSTCHPMNLFLKKFVLIIINTSLTILGLVSGFPGPKLESLELGKELATGKISQG